MRHVRQRNDRDCGIAVAAMLCGVSYRAVVCAAGIDPRREQGLYVSEMRALLTALTGRPWHGSRCGPGLCLDQARGLGGRFALVLGHVGAPFGHWIALEHDTAYDPELRAPVSLDQYPRRHWCVLRAITGEP